MKLIDLYEAKFDHLKYDDVHDWAEDFAQHIGSAFEMWLGTKQQEALWGLAKDGHKVKEKMYSFENATTPERESAIKARMQDSIDKLSQQGWEVFSMTENGDHAYILLTHKP